MSTSPINRPIHLARRDAYFERAVELLGHPIDGLSPSQRQDLITRVLEALRIARKHGAFASNDVEASPREQDFLRFLDLKIETVRSARAMIHHQIVLQQEEGFLSKFLETEPQEFHLPAMHFQRRAEDIIHGLWHILSLAQSPIHALRSETRDALREEQGDRYDRAYEVARGEARERFVLSQG